MEIHPRRFGDSLNDWFRSLGKNWKPLLFSSLLVEIPLAVILAIVFWVTGASESFAFYLDVEALEGMTDAEALDALAPLLWATAVWVILQVLGGVFVYLASSRTVALDISGTPPSWREVSRFAARKTGTGIATTLIVLVGVALIAGAATLIGWVVISAGGVGFLTVFLTTTAALTALVVIVWLGVSVSLVAQVIAMDGAGPVAAIERSFRLVQGRWWATLGYLLLASLIASAASQLLSLLVTPLLIVGVAVPGVLAIAFALSTVLQGPLLAAIGVAYSIWYVDLRARTRSLVPDDLL
jgi:hypothetical protein